MLETTQSVGYAPSRCLVHLGELLAAFFSVGLELVSASHVCWHYASIHQ